MKLSVLLLALTSMNTFAASSATLHLMGTVPKKLDISLDVSAANLDLSTNKTDYKVATVTEKSNSTSGYKITISSQNLGKLKRVGGNESVNYTLKYGASSMGINSAAGSTQTMAGVGVTTQTRDVLISYVGAAPETMVEGTYDDTLTFSISAN